MSGDKYDLTLFIRNNFHETIEYLNRNNIRIEGRLSLIIVGSLEEFQQMYKTNEKFKFARYVSEKREIQIIKNGLKRIINNDINDQNKIFIGNLFPITHNGILWPVYKNDNDIEKAIAKADTESILIHEIGHHIVGQSDWKASFVEFLVYFYKNELYKYPEVYKIMEENTKKCKKIYTRKNPPSYLPYSLGYCFANDIIYAYENILNKNKESPKLNIKDTIEKYKHFSEDDGIKITKMVNKLLKDYVNIKNMLNIKANILSCLLEKLPNITNNI
jgi:hypothetical protein